MILCVSCFIQQVCFCVCPRSCGQWWVSGWDDGLQTDADGGFLSESGDRAALSQRDRGSLLRSAPQRTNAALPDEGRPRRHGSHRPQLSEGGRSKTSSQLPEMFICCWLRGHFMKLIFSILSCKRWMLSLSWWLKMLHSFWSFWAAITFCCITSASF